MSMSVLYSKSDYLSVLLSECCYDNNNFFKPIISAMVSDKKYNSSKRKTLAVTSQSRQN